MAPSAAVSMFRTRRRGSYSSSTIPYDHTSLPPLQTSTPHPKFDEPSSLTTNKKPSPGFRLPSFVEPPTDDSAASRMTALPRFSDELHHYRPSSTTFERPGLPTTSSLTSRAQNFVFSLQPPRRFVPSLAPHETPVQSPGAAGFHVYGDQSNTEHLSTSSLTVAEDAVSHKSASSRLGKGKFNLRHPLSLLARRRYSQNQLPKPEEGSFNVNTIHTSNLRDSYDPRIRGKIVHDFSIPKARRLHSYNGVSSAETSPSIDSRPSTSTQSTRKGSENVPALGWLAGRAPQSPIHSPLFKEHFDDDDQALRPPSTDSLHTLATAPVTQTANEPPQLPPFAKSLPLDIFGNLDEEGKDVTSASVEMRDIPELPNVSSDLVPGESVARKNSSSPVASSITSQSFDKRSSPTRDHIRPGDGLPKHMTSTSSRFSFQLSGMGSEAQERLLEEKHKQHAASKISQMRNHGDIESEGSRYSDTDLSDNDDIEERIPGVNADSDGEFDDGCQGQSLNSFQSTPTSALMSPSSVNLAGCPPISQDGDGTAIGFYNTKASHDFSPIPHSLDFNPKLLEQASWFNGLGIKLLGKPPSPSHPGMIKVPLQLESVQDTDDLYFDDGNITGLGDVSDAESFDEDLLDDETGQIHDIPAQNLRKLQLAQQRASEELSEPESDSQLTNGASTSNVEEKSTLPILSHPDLITVGTGSEIEQQEVNILTDSLRNGLTEDNLAYQNSLVSAANNAVAQGRFSRDLSVSQDSQEYMLKAQAPESQSGLMSDESHLGRFAPFCDHVGAEKQCDDYVFDDCPEDDPMIAEANAEVLENDDEGFYGQEFGFYARAHGKGNSEMVNGGYFGPKGVEGIHRSHSAKANFQEPSLTPITERSEWSHRNSIASIHTLGLPQSAQTMQSPGIAQLLDLDSPSLEDDMTLSALMKLRRGAWGGSQTSLSSSGGSQAGSSPLPQLPSKDSLGSHLGPFEHGSPTFNDFPRHPYNSALMLPDVFEEERSRRNSNATTTQSTNLQRLSDTVPNPLMQDHALHSHPLSRSSQASERVAQSHSRASSGSESVSYIKDPEGSGRWLLERRRTGDDGEVHVVEREYLAGARI